MDPLSLTLGIVIGALGFWLGQQAAALLERYDERSKSL